jgi:hypothetical protein
LPTEFMPERTLFYWSKMFTSQIQSGDGYELLKKAHVVFQGLIPGKRW